MRRNSRIKNQKEKSVTDKIIIYCGIGVAILTLVLVGLLIYSKSLSDNVKDSTMSLEKMSSINQTNENTLNENTASASTDIGKNVEESKEELNTTNNSNTMQNSTTTNTVTNTTNTTNSTNTAKANNTTTESNQTVEETKKELSFQKPVDGEIMREYAKDNLVYSETLQEWTTHLGIDIKADKTTVVKAAEAGTVKSIKNDPRYGLTIVIEHDNEFQTVYSNLLTSEFVVEGEKVEKRQSIGTVGNTAAFEIADEPHLHFEILKNSIQEDPTIYIK